MIGGFAAESWGHGVPMVPNPKSEAWLLCALQDQPYQDCHKWEQTSGNDRSPNALKIVLDKRLGPLMNFERLCDLIKNRTIDAARIDMPSFHAFRERLHGVMAVAG